MKVALWGVVFVAALVAQHTAPPVALDEPGLQDTMKFIEERLDAIGRVNYVAYRHDDRNPNSHAVEILSLSAEITHPRASSDGCRIDFHAWTSLGGQVTFDRDTGFALKDIREVALLPMDEKMSEANQKARRPAATYHVTPLVFAVTARSRDGHDYPFLLYQRALSIRLTRALSHAVELCGGGSEIY
jgi:hypothetical protein